MTWDPDTPREDLIAQRIRLLEKKAEDVAKATKVIAKQRRKAARLANERDKNKIRSRPLEVDDLVLLYDTLRHIDMSRDMKLKYRWIGPYLISNTTGLGTYCLKEIDGTKLQGTFPANRLKQFVKDEKGYWEPIDLQEDDWTKLFADQNDDTMSDTSDAANVEPPEDWQPKALEPCVPLYSPGTED
ncbi:hypothetical protein DL768_008778 [Monosporascus sp. mg162]|nr:hypothetical protein DL768_008778 [Monosporascus sp. mg162]